jgi:hypothetical protein
MNRQRCKISIEEKKDLFSYTSWRYVHNEKKRLAERYVEFDIESPQINCSGECWQTKSVSYEETRRRRFQQGLPPHNGRWI